MIKDKQLIIRPIITEKMSKLEDAYRQFAFQVDTHMNKLEIKKAIEEKFKVKVENVNTMNFSGKLRNMTVRSNGRVIRTSGSRNGWKKAIVTLEKGYTIELHGTEVK